MADPKKTDKGNLTISNKVEASGGKTTVVVDPKIDPNQTALLLEKNLTDSLMARMKQLLDADSIHMPTNYSFQNALKSAWLILQTVKAKDNGKDVPALTYCTKESIYNTLLDMLIQGLNPAKKQCYFIPFGKQLTLLRSYFGTQMVVKRLDGIDDIFANVIFEGDSFEYRIDPITGLKEIIKHEQKFENIDPEKIIGAWGIIIRKGQKPYVEIMNYAQIKKSWNMGAAGGDSKAHKNFPDEMSKKTILSRTCKSFLNTSDDSSLLMETIHRTTDNEFLLNNDSEIIQAEIEENANRTILQIEESPKGESQSVIDQKKSDQITDSQSGGTAGINSDGQLFKTEDKPEF